MNLIRLLRRKTSLQMFACHLTVIDSLCALTMKSGYTKSSGKRCLFLEEAARTLGEITALDPAEVEARIAAAEGP